jgi:hypothetical protein
LRRIRNQTLFLSNVRHSLSKNQLRENKLR